MSMDESAKTIEAEWAELQDEREMLDRCIVEAEYAVRQATAALAGYRCIKKGSNIPSDIYYPTLVACITEMERVMEL